VRSSGCPLDCNTSCTRPGTSLLLYSLGAGCRSNLETGGAGFPLPNDCAARSASISNASPGDVIASCFRMRIGWRVAASLLVLHFSHSPEEAGVPPQAHLRCKRAGILAVALIFAAGVLSIVLVITIFPLTWQPAVQNSCAADTSAKRCLPLPAAQRQARAAYRCCPRPRAPYRRIPALD